MRPWRRKHPHGSTAIYHPVDADVIRVDSLWPGIFDKISESKPACTPRWDTGEVDRELRPRFGISTYRVGRVDIQQESSEIADVERGYPYVNARTIGTHPNLQSIRKLRQFHCARVKRQGTAILQTYFRR